MSRPVQTADDKLTLRAVREAVSAVPDLATLPRFVDRRGGAQIVARFSGAGENNGAEKTLIRPFTAPSSGVL